MTADASNTTVTIIEKECAECGEEFESVEGLTRYCPDCRVLTIAESVNMPSPSDEPLMEFGPLSHGRHDGR